FDPPAHGCGLAAVMGRRRAEPVPWLEAPWCTRNSCPSAATQAALRAPPRVHASNAFPFTDAAGFGGWLVWELQTPRPAAVRPYGLRRQEQERVSKQPGQRGTRGDRVRPAHHREMRIRPGLE